MRAAQRRAPEHAVQPQVGGVRELAGDLQDAVGARGAARRRRPRRAVACSCRLPRSAAGALAREVGARARLVDGAQLAALDDDPRRRRAACPPAARGPSTSAATGSAMPGVAQPVEAPQRDVGQLARLERAELVVAAQAAGAVRSWPARAPRARSAPAGPPRSRAAQQRLAQLPASSPASWEAAPSTPRPTGAPASSSSAHRRDARAEPGVGARAVRDAGAGRAERRDLGVVRCTPWASQTSSPSQPSCSRYSTGPQPKRSQAVLLLVDGLGEVGVQPHAARAGQLRRLAHQLAR